MKPTLLLVALALGAALLVSGCTQSPAPAAATKAPTAGSPVVSSSDAKELESLLNATAPALPNLDLNLSL